MALIFVNRYFYPDISATSQMLSDLAMDLAQHSDFAQQDIVVVTSRQRSTDAKAQLPARERIAGVDVIRVWSTHFGRQSLLGRSADYLSFHLGAFWVLLRILCRSDCVVAATDPPMLGLSVSSAASLKGARVLNWLHDLFPETAIALGIIGVRGRLGQLLQALRDRALRAANGTVVLSDAMAKRVAQAGVARHRLHVIPNWSDAQAITPLAQQDNVLRAEWGLEGKLVIGYSGNVGRAHDLSVLPDVAQRFSEAPHIVFLIIGDGAGMASLRDEVRQRNLSNVHFKPYQAREDLSQSLGAIDIHLISLRPELEGLIVPSKLYGVLAAGRASVLLGEADSEVGNLLLEHKAGAVCSDFQNAAAVYAVLKQLCQDEGTREAMACAARALLCERFDKQIALGKWRQVLLQQMENI